MKKLYLAASLAFAGCALSQCKSKFGLDPEITNPVDFDKRAVEIMDSLESRMYGKWNFREIEFDIRYSPATGSVKKDTTFTDFAELDIKSISRDEDERYPVCKGDLLLQGKTWPVAFRMMASAERIVEKTGPQAFALFETNFPNGSRPWKDDEIFFRDLGLTGENYSIEVDYATNTMTWKGLNRDIKQIVLEKR